MKQIVGAAKEPLLSPAALPATIQRKPKTTAREDRLVNTAAEIASECPEGEDLAFMHAIMCQLGLPRSKTDEREFLRKSGDFWAPRITASLT